jgi:hypothetical protein
VRTPRLPNGTLLELYAANKDDVEDGGKNSVPMGKEETGGVMEAILKRERREGLIDRVCSAMKPICHCFSVAAKQARDAEIDVPSKRRFRQIYASGDADSSLPQDAGTGLHEVVARTGIGMRTFLDCLDDARNQVEESRSDALRRLSYRRLPE